MREEKLKVSDGFVIALTIFPVEKPKAIVQIIHGAKEHRKRYYDFATFLQKNGFYVMVSDNRGHGESVSSDYPLGFMDGFERIIEDQYDIMKYMKKKLPNVPVYLFGHSLGSMFARVFLEKYDEEIDKLVLSGTANYISLGIIGIFCGKFFSLFRGKSGYSKLLERFANFLDDSWVVGNVDALTKYRNDPFCTYKYPISSMVTIFDINRELHRYAHYACCNSRLPILSISGELDPVTGGDKGLKDTIHTLQKIGYQHIDKTVYPNMYHEVLNERNNQIVYQDILNFFQDS